MDVWDYKIGSKKLFKGRFWYYKNGEKKSKQKSGFLKKKDAETWCIDEKRRLEGLQAGAEKLKVIDFFEKWIKIKESKLSPTTLNGYKVNINHINNHMGQKELNKLRLLDVQELLDDLTKSGLKHKTVKYVYRTLHAALEYAVKSEMIVKNVSNGAEIREDDEKFEVKVYTADDLKNLLIALKEQEHYLYPCVLLASMRGLRRGECLGLRWTDIDFGKGVASIKNNYVKVNKEEIHKKVKTKESERIIDMDGFVAAELMEYQERMHQKKIIQTYVCEINGKLPDPTHISRQLKAFQRANDLPECRFHDLRHTFAVLTLEYGTDLDTLKRLMGHSKVGITSDLYLHQNSNLIKKASRNLDNIFNIETQNNVTLSNKK